MRFRVLGPLEVADGAGVRAVVGERRRDLLAVLLAARGATVPVDTLIDLLWRDSPPANPTAALHTQVSRVRRALADVLTGRCDIVTRPPGYALAVDGGDVDAQRFERHVTRAKAKRGVAAVKLLDDGLSLWRGRAYGEFGDLPRAALEGIRLDELRLAAVEHRAQALLDLGRADDVVPDLEAFVAANPLREGARTTLMRALYLTGRHTDALSHYQDYRRHLGDELGLEPSAALQRLEIEILGHTVAESPSPDGRRTRR